MTQNINFLISGFSRSGTKFLAHVCNLSKVWRVYHEYTGMDHKIQSKITLRQRSEDQSEKCSEGLLSNLKKLFNQNYIGNVNGRLREHLDYFDNIKYKGIICRDPREIMVSLANKQLKSEWEAAAIELAKYNIFYNEHLRTRSDYHFIDFKLMTGDKKYLANLLLELGITDVNVTGEMIKTKINATENKRFHRYRELPQNIKSILAPSLKRWPYETI